MKCRSIVLLTVIASHVLLSGCGEHEQLSTVPDDVSIDEIMFGIDEMGDPLIVYADGNTESDLQQFSARLAPVLARATESTRELQFSFTEDVSNEIATLELDIEDEHSSVEDAQGIVGRQDYPLNWNRNLGGGFHMSMSWNVSSHVGGCIGRALPHATVRLHRHGRQLVNLKAVPLLNGGRRCLGLYESVSGWCRIFCSPTYNDVLRSVAAAVAAAGVSYGTAWLISQIATPVIVGGLVALPVPP